MINRFTTTALISTTLLFTLQGCGQRATSTSPEPTAPKLTLVERSEVREKALETLLGLAQSQTPQIRANALEGLGPIGGTRAENAIKLGLMDDNQGVRTIAAMVIGQNKMTNLRPAVRPLLSDSSEYVQIAAIYTLRSFGEQVDPSPLSRYLLSDPDPRVRAQAAFALGELGDASALPMLREAASANMPRTARGAVEAMRLQVAEAMVKLGDDSALQGIRAALYPSRPEELELTALAIQIIGEVKDRGSTGQLVNLSAYVENGRHHPAEVRLAVADALAKLGQPEGAFLADEYADNPEPAIRAQAAHVYGQTKGPNNIQKLSDMLTDRNEAVRVTAAAGLLKLLEA